MGSGRFARSRPDGQAIIACPVKKKFKTQDKRAAPRKAKLV